ncbi:MAG: iron transporter [Sphingomonadales bacterium 35-56-22]|jgi:NRAMP (natural resistance-associated macrophage protein)-like metal ion transporter|uniref:NRAMP family divalent metal transporter n=1 Tax=Sphingorhabdus sp. TaxID=1902408 RepID=UPI000BD80C15|nr:divalent metal cation transporter [Sphingorhabdus sp.]OYY15289.1 MAG: iron transporter [Sphingomonadales bacterium 35-56-22]OYY97901.1 MAG: iron transporter [Sphingomonadales bacterium 28-56-43]OYZ61229.1 MAG: iron transporter [Sphingomonadales bacterium 24-56-14]OZA83128.1 MAG: iron transporter [Sphingomonadales bacterium 39-57-19]HQS12508.1 divalent metal cation transporter [Sphingorhabdus sp.]
MRTDKKPSTSFLSRLGPGLVTGAADDDPSGIGTHSQIGAQFGYGLSWTFLFSFPLMVAIQEVAAEIGRVTGAGIARNMRRHYPRPLLVLMVGLLLIANIVNLGADLAAMGAAVGLLIGGPIGLYTLLFGIFCIIVEVALSYERYASVLKWATLSLFAYVAVVVVAQVPWGEALTSLVVPRIEWTGAYATAVVAILGTTISPYLFFWQAGQEIEEQKRHKVKPLCITPKEAGPELKRIRIDTLTGMAFSSIVSLAIVFATAATLHANGIRDIETSAQAAEALRPIAGNFAFALFALGIIGTGLLAVPVLAGSAAYAVTEMFGKAGSLDAKPTKARLFYGTIAVTTLLGVSLQYVGIDPARALYWAAVVNGVLAAPLMVIMMLIVRNPRAMGRLTLGRRATITGWIATGVMAVATIVFFATL